MKNEQKNECIELKLKHASLCTDYHKLKTEYNNLLAANENQANKLEKLQANSQNLEKKSNAKSIKL